MIVLLLVGAALAQEIQVVEAGACIRPTELSFLLPESHYDACLEKAQRLEIALDRISALEEQLDLSLAPVDEGLEACTNGLEHLEVAVVAADQRNGALELRVETLKRQRNVAWMVAGGIVLSVGVAVGVAL